MLFDPRFIRPEDLEGAAVPEAAPAMNPAQATPPPPSVRDYLTQKYLAKQQAINDEEAAAQQAVQAPEMAVNLGGVLSSFGAGLSDMAGQGGGGKAQAQAYTDSMRQQLRQRLLGGVQAKRLGLSKEMDLEKAGIDDERQQANLERQIAASNARAAVDQRKLDAMEGKNETLANYLTGKLDLQGRGLDQRGDLASQRLELDRERLKQNRELGLARLAQAVERTNLSREQKAELQNRLSDKQVEVVSKQSEAIEDIDLIATKASAYAKRYPYAQTLNELARAVAADDPTFSALVQDSQLIRKTIGKAYEGGRMTDQDQRFYDRALPNLDEKPETFATKLASIRDRVGSHRGVTLEGYYRQGKSIKGFEDQLGDRKLPPKDGSAPAAAAPAPAAAGDTVKVRRKSDGKVGSMPRSKFDPAKYEEVK